VHKVILLIADNQPIFRAGVRKAIAQEEGLESLEILDCGSGNNGDEVIRQIEDNSPDVLILDVQNPAWNGLDLIKHITNNYPATKVIALSANYNAGESIEVAQAGAAAYMNKDSSAKDLASAMRRSAAGDYPIHSLLKDNPLVELHIPADESVEHTNLTSMNDVADADVSLTLKETEFLYLLAEDRSNKQIAAILGLRDDDVKSCINIILQKLNASNKTHLIMLELCKHWLTIQENENFTDDIVNMVGRDVDIKRNGPTKCSSKKKASSQRSRSKNSTPVDSSR